MYKSYTADDYRKFLEFSPGYQVNGVISCGTYNIPLWKEILDTQLNNAGISFSCIQLAGFLDQIFEYTINGTVYWFSLTYGPVRLSEYLHLACIFGSKLNVHVGSCGGLSPDLEACDLIIPTYVDDPGTSVKMYSKTSRVSPNYELSVKAQALVNKTFRVAKGPIITCQGMMGETMEDVEQWSKEGYYGVEMETATVFAVSNHFNVPSTGIVYISDNLIKEESVFSEQQEQQKEKRLGSKAEVLRIAKELVIG